MSRIVLIGFFSLALVACSKSKDGESSGSSGSSAMGSGSAQTAGGGSAGSAMAAGSGSAMAGSGSAAMAGSGSAAMAGSGSAGSGAGSAVAGAGSGAGSGSAAEPPSFFDGLSHDDKVKLMKTQVMPAMKTAFQKFDAKHFAKFTCKTCHGKAPEKTKFKMPNPELPKLDFAALKAGKQKPKMAEFMAKEVKPQMAKILKEAEYTEANPKGFGCLECHVAKQ